jgi:hypothetical protein
VLDDADQALGVGIRQGTQQYGFHHAEDGGGGSYSQRERDHDDGGKPRAAGQLSKCMVDVLAHMVSPGVKLERPLADVPSARGVKGMPD